MARRFDESEWLNVATRTVNKTSPWEKTAITLSFPADRAIIQISLPGNYDWLRAGWLEQIYGDVSPVVLRRRQLNLNERRLIDLEPVAESKLWFEARHYISSFTIDIKARQYIAESGGGVSNLPGVNFEGEVEFG